MAYVPADDADFVGLIPGTDPVWPLLIANDAAVYEEYSPGLEANPSRVATALAREFRWRVYGNTDNAQIVVGVRAVGVAGPHTVTIATPGVDSDTVSVGADAWYSATLDAMGPRQEVIVSSAALGGGTLAYTGLRCSHSYAAPVAGTRYPSRFRLIGSLWGDPDMPVSSEVQGRLSRNQRYLARDRPVCVAAHVCDTVKAVSTKSPDVWGAYGSGSYGDTDWHSVGRLHVPRCDSSERMFRVDAYVTETTPGTAAFSVKIGPRDEQWTGAGWHSWQVRLGPTAHEVRATVKPGSGNGAAIRTLTVWRTEL